MNAGFSLWVLLVRFFMTRRRWIADEVSGNKLPSSENTLDHLVRVLRARVGQEFDIVAGDVVRRGRVVKRHGGPRRV